MPLRAVAAATILISWMWASIAASQPMIIAATPQAPYKFETDGQLNGIDIEIMREVLTRLEISHEFLLIESEKRLQIEAKAGRIDVLLLYSRNAEREKYLAYPDESYLDISWNFFIRTEDTGRIKYETLDDLKPFKVGATRGVSYTPDFWNAGLNLDLEAENTRQIDKLLARRIDTVPLNTIATLHRAHTEGYRDRIAFLPKPMKSKAYFNVFSKASTHRDMPNLRANYDSIIRDLRDNGTIRRVIDQYLGSSS